MGAKSLKMKPQAFQIIRKLFRPLWYYLKLPGSSSCQGGGAQK